MRSSALQKMSVEMAEVNETPGASSRHSLSASTSSTQRTAVKKQPPLEAIVELIVAHLSKTSKSQESDHIRPKDASEADGIALRYADNSHFQELHDFLKITLVKEDPSEIEKNHLKNSTPFSGSTHHKTNQSRRLWKILNRLLYRHPMAQSQLYAPEILLQRNQGFLHKMVQLLVIKLMDLQWSYTRQQTTTTTTTTRSSLWVPLKSQNSPLAAPSEEDGGCTPTPASDGEMSLMLDKVHLPQLASWFVFVPLGPCRQDGNASSSVLASASGSAQLAVQIWSPDSVKWTVVQASSTSQRRPSLVSLTEGSLSLACPSASSSLNTGVRTECLESGSPTKEPNLVPEEESDSLPTSAVRLFVGQLRKANTETSALKCFHFLLPHVKIYRLVTHTRSNTGRSRGCAWLFVDRDHVADVLRLHKRVFFDERKNGLDGFWAPREVQNISGEEEDQERRILATFATRRASAALRSWKLPRQPMVVEIPAAAPYFLLSTQPLQPRFNSRRVCRSLAFEASPNASTQNSPQTVLCSFRYDPYSPQGKQSVAEGEPPLPVKPPNFDIEQEEEEEVEKGEKERRKEV